MSNTINIYTDGSCLGNPGRGGYAAILMNGDYYKEISQGYRHTTNNRMEFLAAIEALKLIKKKDKKIELYTDSNLLTNTIEKGWLRSWKAKGWKKADKKTPENLDLLIQLDEVISGLNLKVIWIKAHNGHPENERCDELAKNAAGKAKLIDEEYEKINPPQNIPIQKETKSSEKSNNTKTKFEFINDELIITQGRKKLVLNSEEINNLKDIL